MTAVLALVAGVVAATVAWHVGYHRGHANATRELQARVQRHPSVTPIATDGTIAGRR